MSIQATDVNEAAPRRLGLVVHPTRRVDGALDEIRAWASSHGVAVGQVMVPGQTRQLAEPVAVADCDLLVALGGDGTTLRALHAAAPSGRPVLGVACGSLGVLTSVGAGRITWALEEFASGRWSPVTVPGLDVAWEEGSAEVAINDVTVMRDGPGQIVVSITVDEVLYARVAGDGVVAATALGSSAYTIAAGGPILAPGAEGMVVTPLAPHGGSCPPLVAGKASLVTLAIEPSHVPFRCELDGRLAPVAGHLLKVGQRPDYATMVELEGEEPRLTGLRRRGLVLDSPRVIAR
ncbi:MAG: NAD(+)/NADH kinase, partial [Thermoleophilaceae bacterium]